MSFLLFADSRAFHKTHSTEAIAKHGLEFTAVNYCRIFVDRKLWPRVQLLLYLISELNLDTRFATYIA